jgi:DNA-binding CsgD family transcriptional regulator
MLQTDNVTIIALTGVIALFFALSQLILLRKNGLTVSLWSLGQASIGIGLISILTLIQDPLPEAWVLAPTSILLGYLICLAGLGKWAGFKLPKKPMLICLGGVFLTAALFQFSRKVGAPLGSLEAILLAPIAATLIYSAWFTGVEAKSFKSKYIYVISGIYWLKGILIAGLTLGALAAIGDQYIIVTSDVVKLTGIAFLVSTVINNMVWSLQNAQDILIGHARTSQPMSDYSDIVNNSKKSVKLDNGSVGISEDIKNNDSELNNSKKTYSKDVTKSENKTVTNLEALSYEEKLALLEKLTDKEKDVFFLAADGKKNPEIASILNSSEASVKVHRSRMTSKLGLKTVDGLSKLRDDTQVNVNNNEEVKINPSPSSSDFGLT